MQRALLDGLRSVEERRWFAFISDLRIAELGMAVPANDPADEHGI